MKQNLLLGAILAIIVLFLFLRTFGASAVVSIAIPESISEEEAAAWRDLAKKSSFDPRS